MSCVIVLGCYRSGTSAVAGVLHYLGVPMGKDFDEPSPNNPKGYWEDKLFKEYHTQFDLGNEDRAPQLNYWYKELIRSREDEYPLWGLKDPLLCTNLSRFVSNLSTDHRLIVCRRSIEDISKSMGRALNNGRIYRPLAEFYVDSMEKQLATYTGPILELQHIETLLHPEDAVNKIANFVSLPETPEAIAHLK